jgi:formate hydrogenlyase subunit 3/multisubunit Na+/H+ antiporter MnhD subunit
VVAGYNTAALKPESESSNLMTLPPIIPLVLLILGALAVGAGDLARLRRPNLVMVVASSLAVLTGLLVRGDAPLTQIIADWQPVSVFSVPISLRVDQTAWIMSVGLLIAGLATSLAWLAFPGESRPAPRALSLLLIAAAVAGVYASNLLTLTIAWGLLDMMFVVALLVHSGPQVGRRAAVAIILNTTSTMCVWIATLLIENGHDSLYWHLVNLPDGPRLWLAAAGALRLGLYPLHQWLPVDPSRDSNRSALLYAVPTLAGLALWARLAITDNLPETSIVPLLGLISAVVGAVLAWQSSRSRAGLPYVALGLVGLAVLDLNAVTISGTLTAVALNCLFIVISLFIARSFSRREPWWSVGGIVAGLAIMGAPGTLGFATRYAMITNLIRAGEWVMLAGSMVTEAVLIAAVSRIIFTPAPEGDDRPIGLVRQVACGLAIICAAAPLVILAFNPALVPGTSSLSNLLNNLNPVAVLAWVLPIGAGAAIAWRDLRGRPLITPAGHAATDSEATIWLRLIRLDWLNVLVAQLVHRSTALLRGLASVIEGEGGLIWVIVIVIVGVVLTSGAVK